MCPFHTIHTVLSEEMWTVEYPAHVALKRVWTLVETGITLQQPGIPVPGTTSIAASLPLSQPESKLTSSTKYCSSVPGQSECTLNIFRHFQFPHFAPVFLFELDGRFKSASLFSVQFDDVMLS